MIEQLDPRQEIVQEEDAEGEGAESTEASMGELVQGFRRWTFIAPEITPRDVIENTTNEINKVNGKLSSLETSMDQLGIDSPLDEIKKITAERSNAHLFPGDVQAYVAVMATLQQIQAQQAAMQEQMGAMQGGGGPMAASNEAGGAAAVAQGQAQQAQPSLDQVANQSGPAQPATAAGTPGPAGAGIKSTTLVRATPQGGANTLNQLAINRDI